MKIKTYEPKNVSEQVAIMKAIDKSKNINYCEECSNKLDVLSSAVFLHDNKIICQECYERHF